MPKTKQNWLDISSSSESSPQKQLSSESKPQEIEKLTSIKKDSINQGNLKNDLKTVAKDEKKENGNTVMPDQKALEKLNSLTKNTVWLQISCLQKPNQMKQTLLENILKEKIAELRYEKKSNHQIINIFPSRDKHSAYDVKVDIDLAKKWIKQCWAESSQVDLKISDKNLNHNRFQEQSGNNLYKKQSYKPKFQQFTSKNRAEKTYKSPEIYQKEEKKKKKYISKDNFVSQIETKVEARLQERTRHSKYDRAKKRPQVKQKQSKSKSSIFGQNPFEF